MLRSLTLLITACSLVAADGSRSTTILIDGSSTVYPITVAVAERYVAEHPQANIEVLVSGSSSGFRRLLAGEIPIADASRPINLKERELAAKNGIEFIELPIAYDGLTVVVSRQNGFIDHLTLAELKRIWQADKPAMSWREVRAGWPDKPIACFSPGKDSGTFDYFTETVNGTTRSQRTDTTQSEDDNALVQGVVGNQGAISYFGFAYYHDNASMLKAVPIDSGKGPVTPDHATIQSGGYFPLSRPLFIYVNKAAAQSRPEVAAFVSGYLQIVPKIVDEVGYVELGDQLTAAVTARWNARTAGSVLPTPQESHRLAELLVAASPAAAPAKPAVPEGKPAVPDKAVVPDKPAAAPVAVTKPALPAIAAPVAAAVPVPVPVVAPVPVPVAAPVIVAVAPSAPIQREAPAPAPTPVAPPRPAILNDAFGIGLSRVGDASLGMARIALDQSSSLDQVEGQVARLQAELGALRSALPDRRLLEAAIASGVDSLRSAALDLVRLRQSGAAEAVLQDAVLHAADEANRDQAALLAVARSRAELDALRSREEACARFREACERWREQVRVRDQAAAKP